MVDIKSLKNKVIKVSKCAKFPEVYFKELEKHGVSFGKFVDKAFEETFPGLLNNKK